MATHCIHRCPRHDITDPEMQVFYSAWYNSGSLSSNKYCVLSRILPDQNTGGIRGLWSSLSADLSGETKVHQSSLMRMSVLNHSFPKFNEIAVRLPALADVEVTGALQRLLYYSLGPVT